jgi:hypothetical protein
VSISARKRMRLRGQTKLIKDADLAISALSQVQASFQTGKYLLRALKNLRRIKVSLSQGKYITGAIKDSGG